MHIQFIHSLFPHFMLAKCSISKVRRCFSFENNVHIQPGNNCFHLVLHLITFFIVVLFDAYLRCVLIETEFNHSTVWFIHNISQYQFGVNGGDLIHRHIDHFISSVFHILQFICTQKVNHNSIIDTRNWRWLTFFFHLFDDVKL